MAGHAGTRDPMASGVLLGLLGQAVRISEYLMDLPKTYRATVRLGFATETYDAEGNPTGPERAVEVMRGEVESALQVFAGEIEQTPPAYSAVKVDGQPDRKSTRLNSSHGSISYAVFCLKKKKKKEKNKK